MPASLPLKRILWIQLWLWLLPPVGLWMLWKDTLLSRSTKTRLLLYTFIIPIVVILALTLYNIHTVDRAIALNGGS